MLKKYVILLTIILSICFKAYAQDEGQSNVYTSVRSYLNAICTLPVDTIISRCDKLISSGSDNDTKGMIAGTIFDYFTVCPIMGTESVSIHIADNYFLNKVLPWPNEATYPSLYTYAEFNRESLIGKEAPELVLESINGEQSSLRDIRSNYKIVYFYESHCATCAKQTPQLVSFLQNYSADNHITLYAVYTQAERNEWESYVASSFATINNRNIEVINVWDPEATSSFHKKYSVLTTPAMFLLDEDNRIIGRKLDCNALTQLIGQKNEYYDSLKLFLDSLLETQDKESAEYVADAFYDRTSSDPELFRGTMYYIYNYLKSSPSYGFQQGAVYLAGKYIVGMPERWSDEVVNDAAEAIKRFNLNPLGTRATDVSLYTKTGFKKKLLSIKSDRTVIFFHLVSCQDCRRYETELAEMSKELEAAGVKVTAVYVGPDKAEWKQHIRTLPEQWTFLRCSGYDDPVFNLYDIAVVPKIYLLDREKNVIAKDITPETLDELLKQF